MSYNLEVEFKFTVDKNLLPPLSEAVNCNSIRQFYLSQGFSWYDEEAGKQKKGPEIRVVIRNNQKAEITIKCDTEDAAARHEFAIPISVEEANALEEHRVGYTIVKKRYFFKMTAEESPQLFDKVMWEVDVYEAENEGLVVAEFEIPEGFTQEYRFTPPKWVIKNVTGKETFSNGFLAMRPWKIRQDAWKALGFD